MRRKNGFDAFKDALLRGSYDEMPMLELGIDPQLHLSRNTTPQPFFLICEGDTMLAQVSGEARIEFRNSSVNYFDAEVGDFIYVPGGTPHRILPKSECIHIRYKAAEPGLEGVAWYSESTGHEVSRIVWNCANELPQEGYLRACRAFNADPNLRTDATGATLPTIDLAPFRWAEIASEIKAAVAEETERSRKKGVALQAAQGGAKRELAIVPLTTPRPPLKTNSYALARMAPAALSPLFPYFEPGSMVACSAMAGSSDADSSYFVHSNTVHEVLLCVGAVNSPYLLPGAVRVGPLVHPVGEKPDQKMGGQMKGLLVITQRQAVGVPQNEATIFYCEKCDTELFRREYDAMAFPGELEGPADEEMIGLPTISQSAASAIAFNESPTRRTCKHCGHVNPPFDHESYGWEHYRKRTQVAVVARKSMVEMAMANGSHVAAAE